MIELEYAELHGPIFLHGTNLPAKLIVGEGPGRRRDIKLYYDRDHQELYVHFKEKVAIVPKENVASMVEMVNVRPLVIPTMKDGIPIKMSAQVDSPMSHVFAGEGHGKTGKDK